jgi:assimilatory nitrate reductase catalytic subunit
MRHRGLESGDLARVSNGRGEMTVRVKEQAGLQKGRSWMPMHWGSQFMNSAGANALACDATDPYSKQPELKHAAVQIVKRDLPYPVAVLRRCANQAEALTLLQQLRSKLLSAYPYVTLSLYGRQSPLVVFRAASELPIADSAIAQLDQYFGLAGDEGAIVYIDASRKIAKKAIALEGRLLGIRLAGETLAQSWLKQAWQKMNSTPV